MTTTEYLLARLCVDLEKMLTDPPKVSEIRSVLRSFDNLIKKDEKKSDKVANSPKEKQIASEAQEAYFLYPNECNSPSYYKVRKTMEDYNRLHEIIRKEGKESIIAAIKKVIEQAAYIPSLSKFLDQYDAPKPIVMEQQQNKPTYQDVR